MPVRGGGKGIGAMLAKQQVGALLRKGDAIKRYLSLIRSSSVPQFGPMLAPVVRQIVCAPDLSGCGSLRTQAWLLGWSQVAK